MAELTQSAYLAEDFERERERIDALIWGATGITEGESVLLCGLPADISVPRRIVELGARLTIIESRTKAISRAEELGYTVTRGSTSVIPARDNAFDVALAFNYLHEVDPFFHQQIVSELSRVGRRLAIVELATPTDLLGRRIAALYSRAKRELGQFEYYQSLDYWKKLVSMTKAEVSQAVFTFRKVPGPEFLQDTIDFLLDTMEREEAPMEYMDELRDIADESGAKLLPQGRYVLVGATAGELPKRNPTALGKLDRAASDANAERAVPAAPAVEPPAPAIAPAAAAAAASRLPRPRPKRPRGHRRRPRPPSRFVPRSSRRPRSTPPNRSPSTSPSPRRRPRSRVTPRSIRRTGFPPRPRSQASRTSLRPRSSGSASTRRWRRCASRPASASRRFPRSTDPARAGSGSRPRLTTTRASSAGSRR